MRGKTVCWRVSRRANASRRLASRRDYCEIDETARQLLGTAMRQMQFSARGYHRILKLARNHRRPGGVGAGADRAHRGGDPVPAKAGGVARAAQPILASILKMLAPALSCQSLDAWGLFCRQISRHAGYVSGFVHFSYNLRVFMPHDMLTVCPHCHTRIIGHVDVGLNRQVPQSKQWFTEMIPAEVGRKLVGTVRGHGPNTASA